MDLDSANGYPTVDRGSFSGAVGQLSQLSSDWAIH